jgi:hypothetical protein
VVHAHVGNGRRLKAARDELFGPLLVELPGGLALEQLQQVSRGGSAWETALARCWDSMPAASALAEATPDLVTRVLLPRLFPGLGQPAGDWGVIEGDARTAVSGFQIFRGTFDPAYPGREVAVWVGQAEPPRWPDDVDLCVGFVCSPETDGAVVPTAEITNLDGVPRVVFRMPALVPMDAQVPGEIARYQKYIQPEPLRPAYVLLALRELQTFDEIPAGMNGSARKHAQASDAGSAAERRKLAGFRELCLDHLTRSLLEGEIDAGVGRPVRQRGPELLRALFSVACRKRFASYQTLVTARHWKALVAAYRDALKSEHLTPAQRHGQEDVTMAKADAYRVLFNQSSTAAGDSFVRSLGPLVKVTSAADAWSIRFPLHPGESALLEYLRGCPRTQPVPLSAAAEFLRHKGYVTDEASEIAALLEARGYVTTDRDNGLRLAAGRAGLEDHSKKRVLAAKDQLGRLLEPPRLPEPLPTQAVELTKLADDLEGRLTERVAAFRAAREAQRTALRTAIGTVRGISLPAEWLGTGLSTHLAGIGETLKRTQGKLVESLRKEAERIDGELAESASDHLTWAVRWVRRRDSVSALYEKHHGRVAEFEAQAAALLGWVPLNQELFAVAALCEKVGTTDPAPSHELSQLLARTRERFSTDSWEPLQEAAEFRLALRPIGQSLQGLLYSQARAYFGELELLRQRFSQLLPGTPAPEFEAAGTARKKAPGGYAAFAALYQWALGGFKAAFERAKELKVGGSTWSDPKKKKRSWNELSGAVERELSAKGPSAGIDHVAKVGEQVGELLKGFTAAGSGVFDTPGTAPDFDAVRELFLRGEVVIRIEPRR